MSDTQPGWPTQAAEAPLTYSQTGLSGAGFPTQTEASHVAVEESEEAFVRRRDAEIQIWTEMKSQLASVKESEGEARLKLTSTCFPTPIKGTQRYPLNGGYKLKLVHGWNYTLGDKTKSDGQGLPVTIYDQVVELEMAIRNLGPEGNLLADRLINWKPELKVAEYEALARDTASEVEVQAKELIDALLTVTPASPQLSLEEPKPPK